MINRVLKEEYTGQRQMEKLSFRRRKNNCVVDSPYRMMIIMMMLILNVFSIVCEVAIGVLNSLICRLLFILGENCSCSRIKRTLIRCW